MCCLRFVTAAMELPWNFKSKSRPLRIQVTSLSLFRELQSTVHPRCCTCVPSLFLSLRLHGPGWRERNGGFSCTQALCAQTGTLKTGLCATGRMGTWAAPQCAEICNEHMVERTISGGSQQESAARRLGPHPRWRFPYTLLHHGGAGIKLARGVGGRGIGRHANWEESRRGAFRLGTRA